MVCTLRTARTCSTASLVILLISRTGAETLTKYLENCHAEFAPCANDGCDWMYGAWGEDVFAQRCMDHHYVDKVEGFDMTTDGACETDRPEGEKKNKKWHATDCSAVDTVTAHPYKKVNEYFKCLGEMTGKWESADWTVKVDADAVFLPQR